MGGYIDRLLPLNEKGTQVISSLPVHTLKIMLRE